MTDKQGFHISLESPQCGFMAMSVTGGEAFIRYGAAHQPFDSLGDLLRGVTALLNGKDTLTVEWNAEPEQYDWHFQEDGGQIGLRIVHYPDPRRAGEEAREVFAYRLPLKELASDLAAEVRELQARAERDVFESNWRRPFPAQELEQLAETIRQTA